MAAALFASLYASACGGTELENKIFPLAVLVGEENNQCRACYLSQDLSQIADERAQGSNMTAASALADTYYETQKTFEKNNRCQLDMSHTKAVIFHKGYLENGSLPLFLETVRKENTYARNTLVYLTDSSIDQLAELNSALEAPLGSYLEQMAENEQDIKEQSVVTLGTLLNEQANANRTLLIPVLKAHNGMPLIDSYEVIEGFQPKGRIDTKQAQIYYLLGNQLSQLDLTVPSQAQVRLEQIACKRRFTLIDGGVVQQLSLTADAQPITGQAAHGEVERELVSLIEETCRNVQSSRQMDLTDSYRLLARQAPEVYNLYEDGVQEYRENLEYRAKVRVDMVQE